MLQVAVFNPEGKQVETLQVDESLFGSHVRQELLRLAVVRQENNRRVGTAATKSRGMVAGSTKKLYRQKGTGRARVGPKRTHIRRGGGVAFAKVARSFRQGLPKKARRLALDSALLAKLQDGAICVLTELKVDQPSTKTVVGCLKALQVDSTCLLSIGGLDETLYKSCRNIERLRVRPVSDLNVWEILWPKRLVFTREAFDALLAARSN